MGEVIGIIIVALICVLGAYLHTKNKQYNKRIQTLNNKYRIPENKVESACVKGENNIYRQVNYTIWKNKNALNFCDMANDKVERISLDSIEYFTKSGEEHYYNKISGGGGGGTSIGGAIIGGALAGPVGAVIGSRKKVKKIKSEVEKIDNSQTIICFLSDGERRYLIFSSSDLYNYLLKAIPEYEINHINMNEKSNADGNNISERLKELSGLYKDGIITEQEFQTAKQNLLNKI